MWDPGRSAWFGAVGLVALAGAVPAALRSPSAVGLFAVSAALTGSSDGNGLSVTAMMGRVIAAHPD